MIVCVCNRLNEAACREAVRSGQCRGVTCVYRLNGCQPRCGRCMPRMRELLAEHSPTPIAEHLEVGGSAMQAAPAGA